MPQARTDPGGKIGLSINITYRCNTVCAHCDRGIGPLDWRDTRDMTLDDARRLVSQLDRKVGKIKLIGGEPTLHPNLVELCEIFKKACDYIWVVSNGLRKKQDLPKLPRGCRYKIQHLNDKDHYAFFVSPTDIGMEDQMMPDLRTCRAMILCGRGAEPEGFMQCSLARTLLKALGRPLEPHLHDRPAPDPDYEICRHCPLSLGSRANKRLTWRVHAGEIPCPTKSFVGLRQKYKIMYRADAHIRKMAETGRCAILHDGPETTIDRMPDKR